MYQTALATQAYQFLTEFKAQLRNLIDQVNAVNDGALQDGFNPVFLEDGWVSLKGYSWGFVMLYDEPVRLDMTFGPDWPFVGYRISYVGRTSGNRVVWVNSDHPSEVLYSAQQMATFGLRRLASKVGDEHIFTQHQQEQPVTIEHDPYFGNDLLNA